MPAALGLDCVRDSMCAYTRAKSRSRLASMGLARRLTTKFVKYPG